MPKAPSLACIGVRAVGVCTTVHVGILWGADEGVDGFCRSQAEVDFYILLGSTSMSFFNDAVPVAVKRHRSLDPNAPEGLDRSAGVVVKARNHYLEDPRSSRNSSSGRVVGVVVGVAVVRCTCDSGNLL